MATQSQIDANRLNAQKSTGPRTQTGRAAVSANALRHGLCAAFPLSSDEDPEAAAQLLASLREDHQPVGATEEILVFKMAEHFWNWKRAGKLITHLCTCLEFDQATRQFALFLRYQAASDRGFNQNLSQLQKLQKERKQQEERDLQEIGFVSQGAEQPLEAPTETPAQPAAESVPVPAGTREWSIIPPDSWEGSPEELAEAKMFIKAALGIDFDEPTQAA